MFEFNNRKISESKYLAIREILRNLNDPNKMDKIKEILEEEERKPYAIERMNLREQNAKRSSKARTKRIVELDTIINEIDLREYPKQLKPCGGEITEPCDGCNGDHCRPC